ncbi:Ig-like domain-containing protein [uncultured Winogradskyella sp.]|uniref:T9SS type A sorting domain-containing protein n=1 Tax=uncultured Winogradskyella sp. TaxID=395353 RepID=UPI0030D8794B
MKTPKKLTNITFSIVLLFTLFSTINSNAQIPAFPGAEGYGKYTVGGRGGAIYEVTNLNDSGPGSFREACEASGARVVIFKVGGRINLTGPTIKISNPNITIAGQTAPGDGIMITREGIDRPALEIDADEVIIRYIRFRRSTSYSSGNNSDNVWVNSGNNLMFDHCSFAWSSDGNLDIANYDGQPGRPPQVELSNISIQYCIFTNSYGGSNKTFLVSRGPTNISWFRNAWLSTATRNPSVSTPVNEAPTWDCYYEHVNNFHYDYTNGPSYSNNDPSVDAGIYYVNVIKNHAFENGSPSPTIENYPISSRRWLRAATVGNGMEIYVQDNITPYRPNDTYDEWQIGQNGGGQANRNTLIPENLRSYTINSTPIITDNVALWDATDIWANLRTHVGASLPTRDAEDARAVNDVDTGDSTENKVTNVFPIINDGTAYTDSDNDGMPDFWEILEYGNLDSDGVVDTDGDGYTDLEEFLNQTANGQIPDTPAESVVVTPSTATLNVPDTITLSTTFTPINTSNQSGIWTSSDPSIATVASNGLVTSVSGGNVIITFTSNSGGFSDTSVITVTNIVIPLDSVSVNPTDVTLEVGENTELVATLVPTNTTDALGTWTSSNNSIATVDENGFVTAISEGQADVTYTSNNAGLSASSSVTVIDTFFGTYQLYNAATDILIQNIVGDADINLETEGNEINFRSIPQGGDNNPNVESVKVDWTGPSAGTWVESGAIYAGLPNGHVGLNFESYIVEEGTYNFTVTYYSENDAGGNVVAIDSFSLTFLFDTSLVANAGIDQSICVGETTTLTATGGTNFLWSTGETTASINVIPTQTTTYIVTVSNDQGEEDVDDVTVNVNEIPTADAGEDQTICDGETIALTASGGAEYLWSTGETTASILVNPSVETIYSVDVISNNCSSTDNVTVFVNEAPDILVSDDIVIIEGESTNLIVSGAETYLWNTGETSSTIFVSPTQTTTYTVIGTGTTNTCSAQAQVTVIVEELFEASAGADERVCENYSYEVVLTANLGDSYLWNTGETSQSITVSPFSTSTYTVTVTQGTQEDTDDVTVYVDPNPNVVIVNGDNIDIMDGDFVTLSASGANTYEWNNGATQPNIAVSPSVTTTYEVRGYIGDCYDEKQIIINVIPEVIADAGEDVLICLEEVATLTASGGDDYEWSTGETTQTIQVSPTVTTEYSVTVFNALDFDEDSVIVEVDADCEEEQPEVPIGEPQDFAFDVFPNPASDIVNVKLSGSNSLTNVYLYDITGKLIHSARISNEDLSNSSITQIDVSALQTGMYYIKLVDISREISKKLIVN